MDFSGITAFALAMLLLFISEFVKGFGNNAGSRLSNTIARSRKSRKKRRSWFKRIMIVIILTGVIWAAIKLYPFIIAFI